MKFRPQIQLRFRDVEQYALVKDRAAKQSLSVNEFIVRKLEETDVQGKDGREGRAKTQAVSGVPEKPAPPQRAVEPETEEV